MQRCCRKSSSKRWIRLQSQKQHRPFLFFLFVIYFFLFSADDSRRNVRFLVVKLTYACVFLLLLWRMSFLTDVYFSVILHVIVWQLYSCTSAFLCGACFPVFFASFCKHMFSLYFCVFPYRAYFPVLLHVSVSRLR